MRTWILSLCALLLVCSGASSEETGAGLSSPMMDRAIFRDGQVQRLMGQFGAWTVVCEQVSGLKQRYCSLRSSDLRTGDGIAYVDVSTGDDGKPAALLHLPLTVSVAFGVAVEDVTALRGTKLKRGEVGEGLQRRLAIVTCTHRECLAVWSLRASDIHALNAGGIVLTVCTTRPGPLEFATDLRSSSCQAKLASVLPSTGFKEAIAASLR